MRKRTPMQRRHLHLPDPICEVIEQIADESGLTFAEVARRVLENSLADQLQKRLENPKKPKARRTG